MANLQLPLNQDHEVLGSEYCSGYMDSLGKWNTGFYCPASDESQDVFCCGTDSHKYCCTKKDQVVQAEVEDLTVLIGVIVGASAAILIITLVSCFCCSCCLLYKKRNPNGTSLYHLHTTSEHSGVTNMYSLSNAASRSATPLPIGGMVLHQASGMVPPGGGILVGGPNHHASQHHLHTSQLLIDGLVEPHNQYHLIQLNNGNGISHSHTLPHSLSHHGKGFYRGDPDLISHHAQQVLREYGTMGRMAGRQSEPPPYQDPPAPENILLPSIASNNYLTSVEKQNMFMGNNDNVLVSSISQGISTVQSPQQQHHQQQQQHQQPHMIFPHRQQQQQQQQHQHQQQQQLSDDQDDKQLFHSTKF